MGGAAAAAPIATHSGSTDPVVEGWSLSAVGPGLDPSPGIETTATGEHAFWKILDSTPDGGGSYYWPTPDALDYRSDWKIRASVRVVDAPAIPGYPGVGDICVLARDGLNYWTLYLTNDRVGPLGPNVSLARTYFLDTRSDYHTYEIDFSANGPGVEDDTADFLVDGVVVFAGVHRLELYASTAVSLNWGGCSSAGLGEANFESIVFDDATVVPTPTPVPSVTPSPTPTPPGCASDDDCDCREGRMFSRKHRGTNDDDGCDHDHGHRGHGSRIGVGREPDAGNSAGPASRSGFQGGCSVTPSTTSAGAWLAILAIGLASVVARRRIRFRSSLAERSRFG